MSMEIERYKTLEVRCRRAGVQTWRYGDRELWRRAVGVQDVEVWSAGGPCRCVDMKAWSSVGVGTWMHGGMEVWRLASGVATWRHRGLEVWRRAVGVATWRHGALEARCGIGDVEA